MTVHVHTLRGCAASPLAHYLKALGILRLVAQQADAGARALWRDETFLLATALDEKELTRFFCETYAPTPMLAPWNGGSGFYPKDNKSAFDALLTSRASRFATYRDALERATAQVGMRVESPKNDEKNALLAACAREWSQHELEWFTAAVAPASDGAGRYPALLGTGGNDGRLDFTNNFMQRLGDLFSLASGQPNAASARLLRQSMFGVPDRGLLAGKPIGQFLPGRAGGANGSAGFEADSLINPWDYVLMLEGAVTLRVSTLRRLDGAELRQAAAPFALRGTTEGYASASENDDSARGEQWMPLWSRPASLAELHRLFAEARLQCATDRAQSALQAARAIARLGVARGVTKFVRYGFLERNGQSNLAVPLAELRVCHRPEVRLVDEIEPWLDALRVASTRKTAPASWSRAVRRIEALALATCGPEASPRVWQSLLSALGDTEHLVVRSAKEAAAARLAPVPSLSRGWIDAVNDGSTELRVAIAIASQRAPGGIDLPSIRGHCIPLDDSSKRLRFRAGAESIVKDPRVVWVPSRLAESLAAVSARRLIDGRHAAAHGFPLVGEAFAGLDDVAQFVEGRLDERRIAALARGLMALSRDAFDAARLPPPQRGLALHAVFRVAFLPEPVRELSPRCDPELLRLLVAGRLDRALEGAVRRLRAMGLNPKLRIAAADSRMALRLAASLAVPVSRPDLSRLIDLVATPFHVDATTEAR